MGNGGLRTLYFVMGYAFGGFFCTLIASKAAGWPAVLAMVLVGFGMTFAARPWEEIEDGTRGAGRRQP